VAPAAVGLPVLRKDFIVDAWQVWEARAANADSFLLIAAALGNETLAELLALGRELGMEPLVEVHTADELERVLAAGARIVGVNNRNLHTLEVRVETSLELVEIIPQDCIAVSESGLRSVEDLRKLRSAGFDAFLIGESLMREADPGGALQRLIDGVSPRSGNSGVGSSDRSR
jgi:indole-3-glycerol phosphate synthase